jgi:hypothetical protein
MATLTLTIKLDEKKAKKFYAHLKKEHPVYSKTLRMSK